MDKRKGKKKKEEEEAGEARWNHNQVFFFCFFTYEGNELTQHWWLNLLCWGQS